MIYTFTYKDENGDLKTASINEEDSREALKNDYAEVKRRFNPRYVSIEEVGTEPGEALRLKVTVKAPSHYVTAKDDASPKPCDAMTVNIVCYLGYPVTPIKTYYTPNHYLFSPNVYPSGVACTDKWIPLTSSLITVMEKVTHDCIHDPTVTNYGSVANRLAPKWHKEGVAAGRFPTLEPKLLYAVQTVPMPPRRTAIKTRPAPPPMPPRRR